MSSSKARTGLLPALVTLLNLLYPIFVLIGLKYLPPGIIVIALGTVVAVRLALGRRSFLDLVLVTSVVVALILLGIDARVAVLIHPVIVNAGFALVFGYSLLSPPPMVERIARLATPDLPAEAAGYLRGVTIAWLCFFVLNGLAAAWTVAWGTLEQWTLYNGLIAYLLIGAMFLGEWLLRRRFMRRAGRGT